MFKRSVFFYIFLCLWLCMPGSGPGGTAQVQNAKPQPNLNPSGLKVDFGSIPLYFTANRGQVDGRALFYAKASRYTLWLTEEGLVFDSFKSESAEAPAASKAPFPLPGKRESQAFKRDVSRLIFLNAAKHPEIVPVDETALKVNYFIGNDPAKWHTAVPTSGAVLYKNIYDHIDLKVYGIESRIEYDWLVRPGGDPRDIRFKYEDVKGTRVDAEGNLLIETGFGELVHKKPAAYQETGPKGPSEGQSEKGLRATVESTFKKLGKNTYGFEVGKHDARNELVIDPVVLAYSTFLGGNGEDRGFGIAVDDSGHAYVTGQTYSTNFPTLGQYQTDQGGSDVFVTKIDTTKSGTAGLVYSTYLGGSSEDMGWAIAVDDSGNAYVGGQTYSANFPTLNQYQNYRGGGAGEEGFVAKLDGNAGLVYSTFLGGSGGGDMVQGIAADNNGHAYATGYTYCSDFPIKNGYQTTIRGGADFFVTKLDTTQSGTASLAYSTYMGSSANDDGYGIAADASGNAYVTGFAYGSNFPLLNPYQTFGGGNDAIVMKLDTTQSGTASLVYSSYLGGSGGDGGTGIAVDKTGYVYVAGITASANFPTLNPYQSTYKGGQDIFVAKIDTTQGGSASLVYSTYLGGTAYDLCRGLAVDGGVNAYVTGSTLCSDFPIKNEYQIYQGGYDVVIAKFDTTRSGDASLVYSTCLGASGNDGGENIPGGVAVDGSGNAVVTGETWSTTFPTLNAYETYQGAGDAFITKIRTTADIAVTKTSDNLKPKVGEEFNFTVTATNNGPFEATGLKVSDKLPTGLSFVSSTPSQGTYNSSTGVWNVGSLAKDAAATLTLKASADGPGKVTNTASVSALNEADPDNSNDSASKEVTVLTPCTIETSPSGLSITVDTVSYIEPKTFDWEPGSSHTIGVTSPQTGTGTKYIYGSWSDAGAQSHAITVPSAVTTYTANFTTQYSLTTAANPPAGGTVTPAGSDYYDKDQVVQVQAVSQPLFVFTGWSGDLTGTANPATVAMDGPKAVTANFIAGKNLNAVVLTEPSNNATNQPLPLALSWQDTNSSPQETSYKLRIKAEGGAYGYYTLAAGSTSFPIPSLVPGRTYRWNVQAIGTGTTTKNSTWANGGIDFRFTIASKVALRMPTLVSPAHGSTGQPTSVMLQWQDTNSSPQEVSYRVRIKQVGGKYAKYLVAGNSTAFMKSGLAKGVTYSWSVQAVGNGNTILDSAWPADRRFTTTK
jgi:uncharacterized repeat protein (TIGR01451 family)